jgi:hypothetical protein
MRGIAAVCLLLVVLPFGAHAMKVSPGPRVRVSLLSGPEHLTRERIIGTFVRVNDDTLVVRERRGRPERSILIASIQSFEASRGRKSRAGKGALIGLVSGAAAGVATSLIVCSDGECDPGEGPELKGVVSVVMGLAGGLFGTGMGALIGGRFHHDLWEKVPVHDIRMGLDPLGETGPQFRLSMNF